MEETYLSVATYGCSVDVASLHIVARFDFQSFAGSMRLVMGIDEKNRARMFLEGLADTFEARSPLLLKNKSGTRAGTLYMCDDMQIPYVVPVGSRKDVARELKRTMAKALGLRLGRLHWCAFCNDTSDDCVYYDDPENKVGGGVYFCTDCLRYAQKTLGSDKV